MNESRGQVSAIRRAQEAVRHALPINVGPMIQSPLTMPMGMVPCPAPRPTCGTLNFVNFGSCPACDSSTKARQEKRTNRSVDAPHVYLPSIKAGPELREFERKFRYSAASGLSFVTASDIGRLGVYRDAFYGMRRKP